MNRISSLVGKSKAMSPVDKKQRKRRCEPALTEERPKTRQKTAVAKLSQPSKKSISPPQKEHLISGGYIHRAKHVKNFLNLWTVLKNIKKRLSEKQQLEFRATCFGHFLDMKKIIFSASIVHHLLMRQVEHNTNEVMDFKFGGSEAQFSKVDFALVTGLSFGSYPSDEDLNSINSSYICDTYFKGQSNIKLEDLKTSFMTAQFKDDKDAVKLALLYFLSAVVIGIGKKVKFDMKYVKLVENLEMFNSYPWGELSYTITVDSLRNAYEHMKQAMGNSSHNYALKGFSLAFQVWGLEVIPSLASKYATKLNPTCPRILGWEFESKIGFKALQNLIFSKTNYVVHGMLTATQQEKNQAYFSSIQQCYHCPPLVEPVADEGDAADISREDPKTTESMGSPMLNKMQMIFNAILESRDEMRSEIRGLQDETRSMISDAISKIKDEIMDETRSMISDGISKIKDEIMDETRCMISDAMLKMDEIRDEMRFEIRGLQDAIMDRLDNQGNTDVLHTSQPPSFAPPNRKDHPLSQTNEELPEQPCHTPLVSANDKKPTPILWPVDGKLTEAWIKNLMYAFDWSTKNIEPHTFSSVMPVGVLESLICCVSEILRKEPNCLYLNPGDSSVVVVGDLHGQLHDVLYLLADAGFPSANRIFVFNGDYVDRGAWSLETFSLLLACKVFMPHQIYLLRGNHETEGIASHYGFKREVLIKYGHEIGLEVFKNFLNCFKELPLASVINGRVYTTHGGLFRKFNNIKRGKKKTLSLGNLEALSKAVRSKSDFYPETTCSDWICNDVLWSDPSMNAGLSFNTDRACGLFWGPDCTEKFLKRNNLKIIIRSHEDPESRSERDGLSCMTEGYAIDHDVESGKLVTVFSAPDYPQFKEATEEAETEEAEDEEIKETENNEERCKNKGAYVVLEPPSFDNPVFHSFEASPRPEVSWKMYKKHK